ncbi:MAG: SCP2 sterol-binding domain-containing protein [Chromatiales bacterium]|nr:SCP2 sterol-binding domain-containing protein [Chromatiales bacterium]
MDAPLWLTAALEQALNRYLALDPDSAARLARLGSGVVTVEIAGLDLRLHFVPAADRMQVLGRLDGEPDTLIRGAPFDLMRLGLAGGEGIPDAGVEVHGDARLGQHFRDLLARADIDWEEIAARVVGDLTAHKAGNLLRGLAGWAQRAGQGLREDGTEYLQEESGLLPTPSEVTQFLDEVDRLRGDVDRVEARIARLERKLSTHT